jgi:hypothetical protein
VRKLGQIAVVQLRPLGLGGERDQPRLEVLHMRLVEVLVLAGEDDGVGPEVLLLGVLVEPRPDDVSLAHVDARQLT